MRTSFRTKFYMKGNRTCLSRCAYFGCEGLTQLSVCTKNRIGDKRGDGPCCVSPRVVLTHDDEGTCTECEH